MIHFADTGDETTACGLFVAKLRTLGDHTATDVPSDVDCSACIAAMPACAVCGAPIDDYETRCASCEAALAQPRHDAATIAGRA